MRQEIWIFSPLQTLVIAGALPFFVMREGELHGNGQKRAGSQLFLGLSEDHRAVLAVLLHRVEFFFGQPSWLAQDGVRDAGCADIVQRR